MAGAGLSSQMRAFDGALYLAESRTCHIWGVEIVFLGRVVVRARAAGYCHR